MDSTVRDRKQSGRAADSAIRSGTGEQTGRGREPPPLDPRRVLTEEDLDTALEGLPGLSREAARALYRRLYRRPPPPCFTRDLLIRAAAYRLQEQVSGGLSSETKLLLDRLARGKAQRGRWIKPGSTIVRSWGGGTHQVVITSQGFLWNGSHYASLSEIARLITGTRWNGPRFFGLRSGNRAGDQDSPERATPSSPDDLRLAPRRRGRPRKAPALMGTSQTGEAGHGL